MKRINFIFISLIVFSFSISDSFAWGQTGHRVVGKVSEKYLNSKTKKAIRAVLGNESVAMASNWADFIKSEPSYDYLNSWHYVNIPSGLTRDAVIEELTQDTVANAYNRLLFLKNELKSNKDLTLGTKKLYLRILIHLVGDIHQPMHVGRAEDQGGNKIKVYWFGEPTNLHRLWDEQLVAYQLLGFTEYTTAINFSTKQERKILQNAAPADWVYESYELASELYKGVNAEDRLSYRYNYDYVEMMNAQLLKGGVRLAGILNEIFS